MVSLKTGEYNKHTNSKHDFVQVFKVIIFHPPFKQMNNDLFRFCYAIINIATAFSFYNNF